jgi:hypothetical protein
MTRRPPDDLESRLGRDLRSLTDGVEQPRDWRSEARAVAERAGAVAPPWRGWLVRTGAVAAGVAAIALGIVVGMPPAPPASSPEPSGSAAPSQTSPMPSTVATPSSSPDATPGATPGAARPDLATTAWWDVAYFEFGYVEPPAPDAPILPPGGIQLRIGTLDGTVRAMLVLSSEWGHWAVGGPRNGRVLVADDIGGASLVRSVNAVTGEIVPIFASDGIVTAIEPAADGDGFFYAKADPASGADLGVWFRSSEGSEVRVDIGPEGFELGDVNVWRLAASPDGRYLVAQYCRGQVSCESHILDLEAGERAVIDHLGWVEWIQGSVAYAGSMAMDLESTAVALSSAPSTDDRRYLYDAETPEGWFPAWPVVTADDALGTGTNEGRAILRHADGDELRTPPLKLEWPVACGPIIPRQLPSGRTTEIAILTLEEGIRGARIGTDDDLVFESFGNFSVDVVDAEIVSIRGETAQLTWSRWPWDLPPDTEFPGLERLVPAFLFGRDGCGYSVVLPGLTLEEAREYAARF